MGKGFDVKLRFNTRQHQMDFADKTANAQKILDSEVLKDSNYFIPIDTSTLEKSGIKETVIGSGFVQWSTPYARIQYYGVNFDHSKSQNPNASAKWFAQAKARFKKKWVEKVKHEYNSNS